MVVDMLEGLHKKFKKEYDETVEDEANKAHYYALEMKHLTFTIAESTADRGECCEQGGSSCRICEGPGPLD